MPRNDALGEDSALVVWAHLSDIHAGHGPARHALDQRLVLEALASDLCSADLPRPDALFVTGDIADRGGCAKSSALSESEYTLASEWLLRLARRLDLSSASIFVVAGNHDVDRSADSDRNIARLVNGLREGREDIDAALVEPNDSAALLLRQAGFLRFANQFAPAHLVSAASSTPYWSHRMEIRDGYVLRVVGLNTALLCANDADKGRLRMGRLQLQALVTPPVGSNEIVVALSHHPLNEGWLADEREIDGWIRSRAHVHICGHVHSAESERTRSGGGSSLIRIVAGAAHGDETQTGQSAGHGYNVVALLAGAAGELVLRVWPRRWSDKNKDFRADLDNVAGPQIYAEHRFSLAKRSAANEGSPTASSTASLPKRYVSGHVLTSQGLISETTGRLIAPPPPGPTARIRAQAPITEVLRTDASSSLQRLALAAASLGMPELISRLAELHGLVLNNAYRIDSICRIGSQFAVYRGKDLRWQRPVAVKLPLVDYSRPASFGRNEMLRARHAAAREWNSLTVQSSCAGVFPRALDIVTASNPLLTSRGSDAVWRSETFLVQEWIDGHNLDDIRQAIFSRAPDPSELNDIVEKIAAAIGIVTSRLVPMVFADVSPRNIFWNPTTGAARLVDAGSLVEAGTPLWECGGSGAARIVTPVTLASDLLTRTNAARGKSSCLPRGRFQIV